MISSPELIVHATGRAFASPDETIPVRSAPFPVRVTAGLEKALAISVAGSIVSVAGSIASVGEMIDHVCGRDHFFAGVDHL
jgi:hypothetical protein